MTTIVRSGSSRAMASAASRRLTAISVGVCPSSRTWPAVTFSAPGSCRPGGPSAPSVRSRRPPARPPLVASQRTPGSTMLFASVAAQLPPALAVRPTAPALVPRSSAMPSSATPTRDPCHPNGRRRLDRGRSGASTRPGASSTAPSRIARCSRATWTSAIRSTARCSSSASCRSRASSRAATSAPRSPSTTSSRSPASAWSRRSTASTSSARSPSRATRCRPSSARSSATSATARGRCASRATCRSSR